ncbi:SDR family NAD(P)-dependent oxidoreductase [Lentzea tibetensis]|uniref:SDR family NAD(P)-dependent oxidoreductase n=1 Tax=Lentzea tibetensis TaxID=2591470 RepID=A0A563F1V7_9PSEU|nr:type I polyketide synthase [Lentzea tibetensis]TWP53976.1 SDR family NAD(P)-dependent oxidoreductase [Lentzea tibetensis]
MLSDRELVLGVGPFGAPNAALVVAVERAGGLGVLDLGLDPGRARAGVDHVVRRLERAFGVRMAAPCPVSLPAAVDTVLLDLEQYRPQRSELGDRRILVEVTSIDEAVDALAYGAHGLIAKGAESGGRVGTSSAFVLLQQLLDVVELPVWVAGGIGPDTAAAAVAGGAAGVVLDSQLALVREARKHISREIVNTVTGMDGGETVVVGGKRVLRRDNAVAIGQEAAFADSLKRSFGTAGGVVQAIHAAIRGNLKIARTHHSLRVDGPLCQRVPGLRYPIAQGPMTRVSDQPAFAAAVAEGGGLPFLALALMDGQQTAKLLDDTARLLGDRPWGVGLLGFADPDVQAAQLAAVHRTRPPYAIVAGGTPAQAKALEDAGTQAFLHVPSPALLARFLDEGARNFVFEGSECGGHIGPRSSFTLWQQQIDVLRGRAKDVGVLFAGGIHDERSAAMVSALSAPLAAEGAAIGVLMGTAYLFTEEAVRLGAIQPVFQEVALECADTALLETSPGHSVRCARTSYVDTFETARAELADLPRQESWERLEKLNLGRLRIASRGLVRTGDGLEAVSEETQRADGMFMIGQVATMRSTLTDIATLHREVTSGELLEARCALFDEDVPAAEPLDVAIIGMAAVMPGARDVAEYWSGVLNGTDAVTEVPPDRWDPDRYGSPFRWGGFLPRIPFDPLAYGIPPASLTSIEPAQLLALEVSAQALADAGYRTRVFDRARTSVIFGAEAGADLANAYTVRTALPALYATPPEALKEFLPALTEDSFPGVLGNVIAGRIANRLDLGGANYTVDAACASSLAALDVACKELVGGTSDMVLCGAVDLHNSAHDYEMFASVHALSPSGRCATFDSAADGITLGEGVACVVLKRLADAERDGDRIYAVIKGIGASSDGKSLGLTAPRADGQRRALDRAYSSAGLLITAVGLVEAHGTGTVVGDRTELAALTDVFTEAGAGAGSCTIGSVKSQIGHTKCAAGMAGLIKAALSVHSGVKPGTLHVEEPNAFWDAETSPFTFGARTWSAPAGERVAGVSAFGFGGTNFHTVLTGYDGADEPAHGLAEWPAELFLFRGDDRAAAQRAAAEIARLAADVRTPLRALAAASSEIPSAEFSGPGRPRADAEPGPLGSPPVRATAVVASREELLKALEDIAAWRPSDKVRLRDEAGEAPQVAFLYPGQGSQRPGMLFDLFTAFPRMQAALRLADGRYEHVMFPPAALTPADAERQRAAITDTRMAQPTLGIAGLACTRLLAGLGVRPDMAGGHSYGELVALAAAGVLAPQQLLELSAARAEAIVGAVGDEPGTMAAVSATLDEVEPLLTGDVVVANHNSPKQVVISGPSAAVEAAMAELVAAGLSVRRIPVAAAFHSPLMAGARERFADVLATHELGEPSIPVWSNVDAKPHADVRHGLAEQLAGRVRFVEQVESMYAAGARVFVEAGPGGVLTSFVRATLGDRPHTAVRIDDRGVATFLDALAQLAIAGVPVDETPLFDGRAEPAVGVRPSPNWYVDGGLVRDANGDALPGGLRPATEAPTLTTGGNASRDSVVEKFLDGMRDAVSAQRDVLLSYLGGAVTATAPPAPPSPRPAAAEVTAPVPEPVTEDIGAIVLRTISARTGYPPEMLEPGLDLEADLSVDSIKRTEIIGELAAVLGVSGASVDELARIKTIEGIVGWFGATPAPAGRLVRLVPEVVACEPVEPAELGDRTVLIIDDNGIGLELADLVERHGGTPRTEPAFPADLSGVDTVVCLGARLPQSFDDLRACLLGGVNVVVVTTGGGTFGFGETPDELPADIGLHGFVRTAALEYPDLVVRAVDVNPKESHRVIATALLAELCTTDGPVVVGHAGGRRHTISLRPADLADARLELDADAVVLLTGGAKGITALAAIALAESSGCHIELIGRTATPTGLEDPRTAAASDEAGVRRALIEMGAKDRDAVAADARRILAEREVRQNLDRLRASASSVRYHECDVTDADAVAAVIADITARFGRLDGVVHGAGVLDDRFIADKTAESFARVYDTKVLGARALAGALPSLSFLVLFGSVSGVDGNRGQADYSAANDALDRMARFWATQTDARVVSVDWGPWAGAGMVSPELAAEYARRGVPLIDPEAGVAALLKEIAAGQDVQVICRWEE